MSSSLFQILAGVSAWLRVSRTQSCFATLVVFVCARVCVCVCESVCLLSLAWLEMKCWARTKTNRKTHTVGSGSWNALGKFPTLPRGRAASTASSSESEELLISRRGRLAQHWYASSWMRMWSEEDQRANQLRKATVCHICSRTLISMTASLVPHPMNKKETLRLPLTLTIAEQLPERLKWLWIELKPPCWSTCLSDCLSCASYPGHSEIIYA